MNKWFYFNGLLLFLTILKFINSSMHISIIFGFVGFLFFLINWTRHAMFSTIRSNISRQKKIAYAKFSKRFLPFHKWTGSFTFVLIIFHVFFILKRYTFSFTHIKLLTGLLAGTTLLFVVIFGWLRLYWPSTLKRFTHLYLAIALFFFLLLHIVIV